MDAQRALLDELMGAGTYVSFSHSQFTKSTIPKLTNLYVVNFSARNLTEEERKGYKEVSWDDKEVCGFYMVRFCPHDLFVNTRSDLGAFQFLLQFIQFQFSVV